VSSASNGPKETKVLGIPLPLRSSNINRQYLIINALINSGRPSKYEKFSRFRERFL